MTRSVVFYTLWFLRHCGLLRLSHRFMPTMKSPDSHPLVYQTVARDCVYCVLPYTGVNDDTVRNN